MLNWDTVLFRKLSKCPNYDPDTEYHDQPLYDGRTPVFRLLCVRNKVWKVVFDRDLQIWGMGAMNLDYCQIYYRFGTPQGDTCPLWVAVVSRDELQSYAHFTCVESLVIELRERTPYSVERYYTDTSVATMPSAVATCFAMSEYDLNTVSYSGKWKHIAFFPQLDLKKIEVPDFVINEKDD